MKSKTLEKLVLAANSGSGAVIMGGAAAASNSISAGLTLLVGGVWTGIGALHAYSYAADGDTRAPTEMINDYLFYGFGVALTGFSIGAAICGETASSAYLGLYGMGWFLFGSKSTLKRAANKRKYSEMIGGD